jgi:hypothetical protein
MREQRAADHRAGGVADQERGGVDGEEGRDREDGEQRGRKRPAADRDGLRRGLHERVRLLHVRRSTSDGTSAPRSRKSCRRSSRNAGVRVLSGASRLSSGSAITGSAIASNPS